MKNLRNVVSKVLVMVLVIHLLLPSGIVHADTGMKYLRVNQEITAFYPRLSRDDKRKGKINSISNQKKRLLQCLTICVPGIQTETGSI